MQKVRKLKSSRARVFKASLLAQSTAIDALRIAKAEFLDPRLVRGSAPSPGSHILKHRNILRPILITFETVEDLIGWSGVDEDHRWDLEDAYENGMRARQLTYIYDSCQGTKGAREGRKS